MVPGQPSQTLLRSAIRKAAHQLLDDPPIFRDPIVVDLVPEVQEQAMLNSLDMPGAPAAKRFRLLFAIRSRFEEDRLALAAARGVRQLLMIGAGLDTFPWRQPNYAKTFRIFSADYPASSDWVQQRFRERGFLPPSNLTFVPVDLELQNLDEQLGASGFDREHPTFMSILGVTQYLTEGAIDAVFRFAASLSQGSEFVFSFVPPDDELEGEDLRGATSSSIRTGALGEPWKTRLSSRGLAERLRQLGFQEIVHLTPAAAHQHYLASHADVQSIPGWEQTMAAVLQPPSTR